MENKKVENKASNRIKKVAVKRKRKQRKILSGGDREKTERSVTRDLTKLSIDKDEAKDRIR